MGFVRSAFHLGLVLILVFGAEVYARIQGFDSIFSEKGKDFIRKQLNFGDMDAMCEESEWFVKYNEEIERAKQSLMELNQLTKEFQQEAEEVSDLGYELTLLQKELKAETAKCVS